MTEFRKVVQCPKCRFANRQGDKRCIICKTELPTNAPEPAAPSPAAAKPPPPGVVRKAAELAKAAPAATVQTRRPDPITEIRAAVAESALGGPNGEEKAEPPPKPLTRRVAKPSLVADAVAWLWCDPLPPIPLVSGKQVIVGRVDGCDLVLPHKEVSRSHAVFKVSGKQITLEDQGSSNGCYVNGKRSAGHIVKVGDMIQIGPYEIEIKNSGEQVRSDLAGDTKSFDLTSVGSAGPGASMTGKLSDVPLVEILQQIEFNNRTCTLAISDGKLKGQIVFAIGRPMTANFGVERDMEAVRAMLRLKEGRFVLSNEIEPVEASMTLTVTALLLEASREIDESGAPRQQETSAEPPSADAYGSQPVEPDAYGMQPVDPTEDLKGTAAIEEPLPPGTLPGSDEPPGDER